MKHELKLDIPYFEDVWLGYKTFEVREERSDRKFRERDILILSEWDPDRHCETGRSCFKTVSYILRNFHGLKPNWVVLGLEII